MKYITFASLIALQMWCADYDHRIEKQFGITAQSGCHFTQPITLVSSAPYFAAPLPANALPVSLTATETAALVTQEEIASYLPQLSTP